MKYEIIRQDTTESLSRVVNRHLVEGWELYGFPFLYLNWWHQAIIKK